MYSQHGRFWTSLLMGIILASSSAAQITTYIGKGGGQQVNVQDVLDITPDGRFVAYESSDSSIVPGDTNGAWDCYLYDRISDSVVRVSVGAGGAQAAGSSNDPSVSNDGTRVAFQSAAANLVPADTNGVADIFVRDLLTGVTTRVSVSSFGVQASQLSFAPMISGNGRFVVFYTGAPELVAGDTNLTFDVFIRDLDTSTTSRISVSSLGLQGDGPSSNPTISTSGRWVVFESNALTLTLNDTNGAKDIFLRDRTLNQTTLISKSTTGVQSTAGCNLPKISGVGNHVVFTSFANNLDSLETASNDNDIFRHEIATGITERVSVDASGAEAASGSDAVDISETGRFITFRSAASDLVGSDNNGIADVFRRDMTTGQTIMVSLDTGGSVGTGGTNSAVPSDGRFIAFKNVGSKLRLRDTFVPWADLGDALEGTHGLPSLVGSGTLEGNTIVSLTLANAVPNSQVFFIGSHVLLHAHFYGGFLVPQADIILPLPTDAAGGFFFPLLWPTDVPSGSTFYLQCWIPDLGAIYGYAASNGLSVTQP